MIEFKEDGREMLRDRDEMLEAAQREIEHWRTIAAEEQKRVVRTEIEVDRLREQLKVSMAATETMTEFAESGKREIRELTGELARVHEFQRRTRGAATLSIAMGLLCKSLRVYHDNGARECYSREHEEAEVALKEYLEDPTDHLKAALDENKALREKLAVAVEALELLRSGAGDYGIEELCKTALRKIRGGA